MEKFELLYEGKVREVYDIGDKLVIAATDRISAFDHILKNKVTDKGAILTQMSKFWFDYTKDVIPNHMISVDVKDMPEFFQNEKYARRSMMCKKLTMLPIECIVRGYITGSGWASYQKNGTVCGIKLPEGLEESEKLPEPIYTPSTKAEIGDHDENISFEQSIEVLEKKFPGKGLEYATKIKDATIALYKKCAEYALSKGIIIADTKFEFGLDENGEVVIGDEMLTPDSSRFWPLEGYKKGQGQPSYDKQFVRNWLLANPDSDYLLPDDISKYDKGEGKTLIVYTADKNEKGDVYTASDKHELDLPMVILINGDSASASEVFTGAMKDYDRATVVGTTSYGKGIVQNLIPLGDGSAIKITTAHYYTPSGFDLHGKGIEPDVAVELDEKLKTQAVVKPEEDNQIQKAVEVLEGKLGK